jgi:hypothetical protein
LIWRGRTFVAAEFQELRRRDCWRFADEEPVRIYLANSDPIPLGDAGNWSVESSVLFSESAWLERGEFA